MLDIMQIASEDFKKIAEKLKLLKGDEEKKKRKRPTEASGKWTPEEIKQFAEGVEKYSLSLDCAIKIKELIPSRSTNQVKKHIQTLINKKKRDSEKKPEPMDVDKDKEKEKEKEKEEKEKLEKEKKEKSEKKKKKKKRKKKKRKIMILHQKSVKRALFQKLLQSVMKMMILMKILILL